jgi:hypothetical protein
MTSATKSEWAVSFGKTVSSITLTMSNPKKTSQRLGDEGTTADDGDGDMGAGVSTVGDGIDIATAVPLRRRTANANSRLAALMAVPARNTQCIRFNGIV